MTKEEKNELFVETVKYTCFVFAFKDMMNKTGMDDSEKFKYLCDLYKRVFEDND